MRKQLLRLRSRTHDYRNRVINEVVTVDTLKLIRQNQYWNNDNLKWVKNREGKWTRYWQDFAYGAPGNYQTIGEDWWTEGTSYDGNVIYNFDDSVNNGLTVTDVTTLGPGTAFSIGQPRFLTVPFSGAIATH